MIPPTKQILGIHVFFSKEGPLFTACLLEKTKGVIYWKDKINQVSSLEKLSHLFKAGIGVCLSVEGKGVIIKQTSGESLQQVLPGIHAQDLWIDTYPKNSPHHWLACIRKVALQSLMDEVKGQKAFILSLSVGPFAVLSLSAHLPEGTIALAYTQLTREGGQLLSVQPLNKEAAQSYSIGDEHIGSEFLLAYATALQGFMLNPQADQYFLEERKEHTYHRLFKRLWPTALAVLLLALLINTVLYVPAFEKQQQLSVQGQALQGSLSTLDSLKIAYSSYEKQMNTLGWGLASHHAYYADQIAASLPAAIQLTSISVHPTQKIQGKDVLQRDFIVIEGRTQEVQPLEEWVQKLNTLPWVVSTSSPAYSWDNTLNTGVFSFNLRYQ